jgi:hypothetical protein
MADDYPSKGGTANAHYPAGVAGSQLQQLKESLACRLQGLIRVRIGFFDSVRLFAPFFLVRESKVRESNSQIVHGQIVCWIHHWWLPS